MAAPARGERGAPRRSANACRRTASTCPSSPRAPVPRAAAAARAGSCGGDRRWGGARLKAGHPRTVPGRAEKVRADQALRRRLSLRGRARASRQPLPSVESLDELLRKCMDEHGVKLPAPNTSGKGPGASTRPGIDTKGSTSLKAEDACRGQAPLIFRCVPPPPEAKRAAPGPKAWAGRRPPDRGPAKRPKGHLRKLPISGRSEKSAANPTNLERRAK